MLSGSVWIRFLYLYIRWQELYNVNSNSWRVLWRRDWLRMLIHICRHT